jgi:hypothetical protein
VKGKPVDGRSDIFSLGVILYELMTGEKPFPGQNITTVIYKIINEEPIPPRSLDSSIHPGLSAVITRALSKDPATRFQNCHELLDALKNYRDLVSPEATVRMAPVSATLSAEGNRSSAPAVRPAVNPQTAHSNGGETPVHLIPENTWEQEEISKKRGSLVLTVILLAIIGFAGYRIYPPMVDLWQRAHESVQKPVTPSGSAPVPPAASSDVPDAKPETKPDAAPAASAPTPNPASVAVINAAPPQALQPAVAQAPAEKASVPIVVSGTGGAQKSSEKSFEVQKPGPSAQTSPAASFESNLRSRLESLLIADKVKTQVIANTLTLSGRLTPAEHRRLLNQLHAVPAGIRIVDDIEYTSDLKETPAADSGWVWVRSEPRGAEILLDGTDTGLRTPARIEMPQGQHSIRLVLGGFASAQRAIAIQPGMTIQFTQPLEKE